MSFQLRKEKGRGSKRRYAHKFKELSIEEKLWFEPKGVK